MQTLEDVVNLVVNDFISSNTMFTALDVSNKVKESLPFTRHMEVRDLVRSIYNTVIEAQGYTRSPIVVTLSDGRKVDALLYHSLADSWDLDVKYDSQMRSQSSSRPAAPSPVGSPTPAPTTKVTSVSVSDHGVTMKTDGTIVVSTTPVTPTVPVTPAIKSNARDLWASLFQSQPSLFPRTK